MICPSVFDVHRGLLALLPRGRAWRTSPAAPDEGSIMARFFRAIAMGHAEIAARFCALRDEMICARAVTLAQEWADDLGFPDGCRAYVSACDKHGRVGDATAAYIIGRLAALGWVITIEEIAINGLEDMTSCKRRFGLMRFGAQTTMRWIVRVDMLNSPASGVLVRPQMRHGMMRFGQLNACPPDIAEPACVIRLISPAHVTLSIVPLS